MNFYVPGPRLNAKADLLLLLMEKFLAARGRAVTDRRIRALIRDDGEGEEEIILVGANRHDCLDGDYPVLLILEDSDEDDLCYVVTIEDAGLGRMPEMLRLDPLWRVVDFD